MSGSRDPPDYSPSGSSVHGISQARILEWVAIYISIFVASICGCKGESESLNVSRDAKGLA